MLHLLPDSGARAASCREPYAEAVSRLASVRHALRLVEPFGGGPASDCRMTTGGRRRLGSRPAKRAAAASTAAPRELVGATAAGSRRC